VFVPGDKVSILAGFTSADREYNVTHIMGSFNHPQDLTVFVYNVRTCVCTTAAPHYPPCGHSPPFASKGMRVSLGMPSFLTMPAHARPYTHSSMRARRVSLRFLEAVVVVDT
jgi:hypothetical protein